MSWLALDAGDPVRAAELSGSSAVVWRQLGTGIEAFGPHLTADSRRKVAETNSTLGTAVADRLRSTQAHRGKLDVVELALGERSTAAIPQQPSPLTPRESEVAQLIAGGLSNRAIADRLVISHRTVDGHVERILAKLEFTSRAQVAVWAATHAAAS